MCRRLKLAIKQDATNAFYFGELLSSLFSCQPIAALDGLCGGDKQELAQGIVLLRDVENSKHPLAVVSDEDLINWCDQEPQTRYPAMAQVIIISRRIGGKMPQQWTSIALRFLERAPDPGAIIRQFTSRFMLEGVWSGSLTAILESNAALLDQFGAYPQLSDVVIEQKERLRQWIEEEQRRETAFHRDGDERFE